MRKIIFDPIGLLAIGLLLAVLKLFYLFFDYYNVLDVVVFTVAGFAIGHKIPPNRLALGLLVALPAFAFCLMLAIRLGYTSIVQGVGTAYVVSSIVIPLATLLGIWLRFKRLRKKAL